MLYTIHMLWFAVFTRLHDIAASIMYSFACYIYSLEGNICLFCHVALFFGIRPFPNSLHFYRQIPTGIQDGFPMYVLSSTLPQKTGNTGHGPLQHVLHLTLNQTFCSCHIRMKVSLQLRSEKCHICILMYIVHCTTWLPFHMCFSHTQLVANLHLFAFCSIIDKTYLYTCTCMYKYTAFTNMLFHFNAACHFYVLVLIGP